MMKLLEVNLGSSPLGWASSSQERLQSWHIVAFLLGGSPSVHPVLFQLSP